MPVIEVKCSPESAVKLLRAKDIAINGHSCYIVKQNTVVYRCYNCQQFGHVARLCTNSKRCINCAAEHSSEIYCTAPSVCSNCKAITNHPACPAYLKKYEALTGELTEHKYVKRLSGAGSTNTSCCSNAVPRGVVGKDELQRLHSDIETSRQ